MSEDAMATQDRAWHRHMNNSRCLRSHDQHDAPAPARFTRTGCALGRDCAKLDANGMTSVLEMLQRVTIAPDAAKLLSSAVCKAAREAKP